MYAFIMSENANNNILSPVVVEILDGGYKGRKGQVLVADRCGLPESFFVRTEGPLTVVLALSRDQVANYLK